MISKLKNKGCINIFWGLMGFYLLNISVDTADHNPFDIPEDVSINDQESIVEIVLESVLGYENAIEEYDDSQTDEPITKTTIKIDLIHHRVLYSILHKANDELKTQNFTDYTAYLVKGFGKLDTPPPKN